jgi:hypothetical protein
VLQRDCCREALLQEVLRRVRLGELQAMTVFTRLGLRVVEGSIILTGLLSAPPAAAEECNPPKPGWSDAPAEAAFDAGVAELESARTAASAAARTASARLAEEQFRIVETRFPCLPPNVVQLAESLTQQGRYLEARDQYDRVLSSRITLSKTSFWRVPIAKAEKSAEDLATRIPEAIFHRESGDCSAASVTMASTRQQLPTAVRKDFDAWFQLDPGEYVVTATGGKCRDFRSVATIADGEKREIGVTLSLAPKEITTPEHGPGGVLPPPNKCLGMPVWVCLVGGGVLAAGAVATAAVLLSKPDDPTPQTYACAQRTATMLGCSFLQ